MGIYLDQPTGWYMFFIVVNNGDFHGELWLIMVNNFRKPPYSQQCI